MLGGVSRRARCVAEPTRTGGARGEGVGKVLGPLALGLVLRLRSWLSSRRFEGGPPVEPKRSTKGEAVDAAAIGTAALDGRRRAVGIAYEERRTGTWWVSRCSAFHLWKFS